MAIKGKKKSQSRGSQGVRRPAAAPRPTVAPRRKTSFWRTRDGMLIGGVLLLVAIGVVVWLVMSAQDRAEEREAEAAAVDTYTDSLQPVLESVTPTANEMNAVASLPEGDELDDLVDDTEGWISDLQAAQALVQQSFAPEEAQPVSDLLGESITMYISAAQTAALLPEADGKLQADLFTQFTQQRDSAGRVMSGAVGALDSLRGEKDLEASGLTVPGMPAPQPAPSAVLTPELSPLPSAPASDGGATGTTETEGGNGKDGKKDGGGG